MTAFAFRIFGTGSRHLGICDILKKKAGGGTTNLNLEKPRISAKGGTYRVEMRE